MGYMSLPHHMVRLLAMSEGLRKVREFIMTVVREYNNIQDVIHESERDLFSEHLFTLDKYMAKGLFNYNWEMNVDGFVGTSIMECRTRFKLISQF
jgi:dynein heavy chain